MGNPTRSDYFVSRPLTSISVAWTTANGLDYAHRAFPIVRSDAQGGLYFRYNREDWARLVARRRAPGTPSAGGGFKLDTASYFAEVRAVHQDIPDPIRTTAQNAGFNLDSDSTKWVSRQMLLEKEFEWFATYFKTGVWGRDVTGVTGTPSAGQFKQWDQSGSTPIKDVQTEAVLMSERTGGYRPNRLSITPYVWLVLSNHADIIERVKYTQKGFISLDLLAAAFGVEQIHVANGSANVTVEGTVSSANTFIGGKNALLTYAPPNPSLMEPSAGYTFAWTGYLGAEAMGQRIKKFRMEELASDRVEGEAAYQMALVAPDVGAYFNGAVA